MIEGRQSTWHLGIMVVVIAVCSNLAEFYIGHTPAFGGMSGVVYGLFGYIWLRGKFDPASGLFLHPTTVVMMIVWFFICLTGYLRAANIIHAVGLGMGLAWGYLSSLRHR
jgi:GlpG protein